MRVSIVEGDPGYMPPGATIGFKILLDGEEQNACVTADEEQGLIVRYKRGEGGKLLAVALDGDLIREEVRGKVEIIRAA
ncbi:hypothetical protein [Roseococcus sp. YIM B11640]|uniref:hypothetical protein n=1 Tax=Roseococcus sp. YIM B11640 TaxID=3133973 RepID=UPI003C7A6AA2